MKPVVKGEIDKMLDAGSIQQTDSPYASPIVMARNLEILEIHGDSVLIIENLTLRPYLILSPCLVSMI